MSDRIFVCIDDNFSKQKERDTSIYIKKYPEYNNVYTLNEIKYINGEFGYIFEELKENVLPNGQTITFNSNRFIKLNEYMYITGQINKLLKELNF